jgi:hypothetical protein
MAETKEREAKPDSHGSMAMRHANFDLHHFKNRYGKLHGEVHDTPGGEYLAMLLGKVQECIDAAKQHHGHHYPDSEPLADHTPEETEEAYGGGDEGDEYEGDGEDEYGAHDMGDDVSVKNPGIGEQDEEGEAHGADYTDVPRPTVGEHHGGDGSGHGLGEEDEEGEGEGAESTRYHDAKAYENTGEEFEHEEAQRLADLHAFLEELHGQGDNPHSLRVLAKYHATGLKDMLMGAQTMEPHEGRVAANPTESVQSSPAAPGHKGAGSSVGYRSISRPRLRRKDALAVSQTVEPHEGRIASPPTESVQTGKSFHEMELTAEQKALYDQKIRALGRRNAMLDNVLAAAASKNGSH